MNRPHVIKVGGSLLTWTNLADVLPRWLANNAGPAALLLTGGGVFADAVLALDAAVRLRPETAHRLAIAAMSLAAEFVLETMPGCALVNDAEQLTKAHGQGHWPLAQPRAWFTDGVDDVPASWDVTSDSLAVLLAQRVQARRLTLLKSRAAVPGTKPADWTAAGLVDGWFPAALARVPGLVVEVVNLRAWRSTSSLAKDEA